MKKLLLLLLGIVIGFLISYFYYCNPQTEIHMTTPNGIITPEEAKALDEAFNSRHQLISDSIVGRPDNRSAWWSIEDIESFIKLAKSQSTDLGYDMNGIRVYLGAHERTSREAGYTTMFMVPTGTPSLSEGKVMSAPPGNGDVPGGNGLNGGENGDPPSANYPQ
ncbi:hypothetical protein Q4512_10430 [Oceanihabitans sp. 2_MG-2023]|uniref:hypothetical protein n=1 Tax=Oceanihabitans sp. 2_MG-2023 TaxID=3062661 RepID=UPI0026E1CE55|nr:hypothetical protein [Oceanihabitans sp. 2_MG-2023]MDO6597329.1 hypothetical protein [Oceanihabitans sp. 2_MG-2023]